MREISHRRLSSVLVLAGILVLRCTAAIPKPNPLSVAEHDLMLSNLNAAIPELQAVLQADPKNGRANLLLCRAFYAEELPDQAVPACEAAVAVSGNDSVAEDWMGRAYGLKADRASPLAGFKLATKVKLAFEAAVALGARNGDAVSDLGEYYVNAPAILGGGLERATELADRFAASLPQQSQRISAMVAEKNRDYGTAEREFRAVVEIGGGPAAWTDLGHFYARREEKDKAVDALRHAIDADRTRDATLVDIASILNRMKQEAKLAEQVLHVYLASGLQSDAAPAFKAHVLLGDLLKADGDKAGARAEYDKALALAHDYAPAQKAIQRL